MQGFGMMRKLGLIAVLAVLPLAGQAATIDLASLGYARGAVVATSSKAEVIVAEDASHTGAFSLDAFAEDAAATLIVTSFDISVLTAAAFLRFDKDVTTSALSGASAFAYGEDTDLVQFLFEGVLGEGAYAGFNNRAVLVEVQAAGLLPFVDGFVTQDEGVITFTVLEKVGVIPLPAGLPLMLAGIGALAVLRRRCSRV